MAATITSTNPRIESVRGYRDLDLSFSIHPVKKDVAKHVNEFAVINSVKNLISTNFFERPFRPEIGSSIRALLFENIDSVIAAQIERAIVETISNFEPRAKVSVVTAIPNPDENKYSVRLEFFVINNPDPITINFFLERIR